MEPIFHWIAQYGYIAIFALLMFGVIGLPVPDEILLTFAGSLVFKQELALVPTIAAAFLGSVCGISLSYVLGRSFGMYLVNALGRFVHINQEKMDHVRAWYDHRGKYALLFGYFLPGIRHLVAFVAGSSTLHLKVFASFAYTGALLWSLSFVALGYFLGEQWARTSPTIHRVLVAASIGVLISLVIVFVIARRRHPSK
ncbi:MAG: DedA family protein [Acidobacteriota bacterium]